MCGQVSDATNSITLDLDVWAQHLPDKRLEAAQLDDEELVLS